MSETNFTTPSPELAVGSVHAGFTVERVEVIEEADGVAYLMRHTSGARLIWLACEDDNRSFTIGFKTPPADDTGVFHIIEHSVLDGSDRFPVKEPFVHLLKSSMHTFLNALTFSDKTVYPVASTNMHDLENLMDVYLDAVFHPRIYTRPSIFGQEAWHYELSGEEGSEELSYNGVVFNEMKGALSDPDTILFEDVCRGLFPDSAYRFESGGDPRAIPQLTYEAFLDSHARHYNLPNSYTFLYGDMDIEHVLAFIAERFDAVETRTAEPANPLVLQAPIQAGYRRVKMATAPENATVGLGYVICDSSDRAAIFNAEILCDALMGSNEAPLKRRLMEAGLGEDVSAQLVDGTLQPVLFVQLKGAKEGVAEEFRTLFETSVAQICTQGIDRALLDASLSRAEFTLREREFGFFTNGIAYAVQALSGWLYDDDAAFDNLHYEDLIGQAKEGLESSLFEDALERMVNASEHSVLVELVPSETGTLEAEAAELAEKLASLDADQRQAIRDGLAVLRAEQEAPDTPEAIATLPRLTVADIGEGAPAPVASALEGPIPCITYGIPTKQVSYVYTYFGLDCVSFEELPYVTVLCHVLGKLGTARHSASELDIAIEGGLGGLSFFTENHPAAGDPDTVNAFLVNGCSALSEKVARAAELPQEIWSSTYFSDTDRILELLTQQRISLEQDFLNAGHSAAMSRASSYFSRAALMDQKLSGLDYYRFLKELLADFDARKEALSEKLAELAKRIFRTGNAQMTFTGSDEDFAAWREAAGDLSLATGTADAILSIPEPGIRNEGIITPGNVCYVAEVFPTRGLGTAYSGKWQVASKVLSLDYLWNEVRVKGGAYGCGMGITGSGLVRCYSYRDPAVDPTADRFEASAEWLKAWDPAQEDFEGYVISTVSGYDAPTKPRAKARRQDTLRLSGRPADWRQELRAQALACTTEDVRGYAEVLAHMGERAGVCVVGSRELLEASGRGLELVELMGN